MLCTFGKQEFICHVCEIVAGVLVEEGTAQSQVVDTALDYVNKKSHLLPNTTLRAETHVFSQDESGLATIQAGG